MTAYKLLRKRRDGTLGSLFVGRAAVLRTGETYRARKDLPHPGLATRPGFHCTANPDAPHIKLRLKNGETRVWCEVRIPSDSAQHVRPRSQGGLWFTARSMTIVRELTCGQCGGTGRWLSELMARCDDSAEPCPMCRGSGIVRYSHEEAKVCPQYERS